MEIMTLLFVAAVTEAIVETIQKIHPHKGAQFEALIVAIILSIATNSCIFCLAGISIKIPYLDACIAGILCSRGSNFLHDFLRLLEETKNSKKESTTQP